MTASTLLMLAITFVSAVVLRNLGHTKGYQDGYKAAVTHNAETIKAFLAWLPGDDRLHFKTKLAEFNTLKLTEVLTALIKASGGPNV